MSDKYVMLGFEYHGIASGANITIVGHHQLGVPFIGEWLFVSHHVASDFYCHDIRIGNRSILTSATPVLFEPFAADIEDVPRISPERELDTEIVLLINATADRLPPKLDMPPCEPGMGININLSNQSAVSRSFRAVLFGKTETPIYERPSPATRRFRR